MLINSIDQHDVRHVIDNLLDEQDEEVLNEHGDEQCHVSGALDKEPDDPSETTTRDQERSQEASRPSI